MSVRFGKEIQEVLRRGDRQLTCGSDHADPNRFALAFRILQPFFLCAFLCLERLGQARELPADIFEQQPPLNDSGHPKLIAQADSVCGTRLFLSINPLLSSKIR